MCIRDRYDIPDVIELGNEAAELSDTVRRVALTLDADARLEVLDPQKVPLGTSSIQPAPPPRRGAEPGEPAQTVSRQPRFDAGHLIAGLEGGRPGDGLGKVITVFSTKGGAGTSMLATSLAVSLTQRSSGPVCLIDADLQFGDAAVMLKLTPRHTIVDAVAALDRIDPNFLGQLLMTHEPSGLRVLAAPLEPAFADRIGASDMVQIVEMLRTFCSVVVIDTLNHFGFDFDAEEIHLFMQLWRYSGYLMGVHPEVLPTSQREGEFPHFARTPFGGFPCPLPFLQLVVGTLTLWGDLVW